MDRESGEKEILLNEEAWQFCLEKDLPDGWEKVTLPHCWNRIDGADGNNDYIRGKGWYRLKLDVSSFCQNGKHLFLEVKAACKVTDVYVDKTHIGTHEGGYSAFCYEITKEIKNPQKMEILLCVDNRVNDLMPLSGDFTVFGGIYRDVRLIVKEDIYFDREDHGSGGVLIRQSGLSHITRQSTRERVFSNGGKISVEGRMRIPEGKKAFLKTMVYDAEGRLVTEKTGELLTGTKETMVQKWEMTVENPHLWNGVQDPYLYRTEVILYDGAGKIRDRVCKETGFRFFCFDEDEGFFLNGNSYPLRGVCKHQDRYLKGYALSKEDLLEDMLLIREIGANAVRFSHYQHDEYVYELADQLGICAWVEIPFVNAMIDSSHFKESTKNNLEELIKQNISHPSIVVWGIHNEQWPNNGGRINTFLRELYELSHQLDDNRKVAVATAQSESVALSWQSDVSAWNKYFGLYEAQDVRYFGTWLDQVRSYAKSHKTIEVTDESTGEVISVKVNGNIGMSEYGVGSNIDYHEECPGYRIGTDFDAFQTEEFQSQWHEIYYEAISQRPWLWGSFIWNMFEFGSDGRSEAGRKGINNKGLVTYDRKIKKDVFFFYQANWSQKPMLHITGKRFRDRFQDRIRVKIYSNLEEIELFLNGKSVGIVKESEVRLHCFCWDIRLKKGKNEVTAVGKNKNQTYTDQVIWDRKIHDHVMFFSELYRFEDEEKNKGIVLDVPAGICVEEFFENVDLKNGTTMEIYDSDRKNTLNKNDVICYDMWVKATSEDQGDVRWYKIQSLPISAGKPIFEKNGEMELDLQDYYYVSYGGEFQWMRYVPIKKKEEEVRGFRLKSSCFRVDNRRKEIIFGKKKNSQEIQREFRVVGNFERLVFLEDRIRVLFQGKYLDYLFKEQGAETLPISLYCPVSAVDTPVSVDAKVVPNENIRDGYFAEHCTDGEEDTIWKGAVNLDRTQSYYPASVIVNLTERSDTDDWYYLTGIRIAWHYETDPCSYLYELHAHNPVGIDGGWDCFGGISRGEDQTEHWVQGKKAQIKDMMLTVVGAEPQRAERAASVKSVTVYGWRLKGDMVDESSNVIRISGKQTSVRELLKQIEPKGNCSVSVKTSEGIEKKESETLTEKDFLIVEDCRGEEFCYSIRYLKEDKEYF